MVKPKNSLLSKKQIADLVSKIVIEVKSEFNNLNIEDLKSDINLVLFVMEKIEDYCSDKNNIDPTTASKIDKNDLVVRIFITLFPNLNDTEKTIIQDSMNFIISSGLLKTTENFFSKISSFISKIL